MATHLIPAELWRGRGLQAQEAEGSPPGSP